MHTMDFKTFVILVSVILTPPLRIPLDILR